MKSIYDRTRKLIGDAGLNKLLSSAVIVFGLGCVGGYTVETLARTGLGRVGIVDHDTIDITNINRQIIALSGTVGKRKTDVFSERIGDINADIKIDTFNKKLTEENIGEFPLEEYDYIIDAIDDVSAKITLIEKASAIDKPIISSMGTGNKIDPSRFKITSIGYTHTCPLAKRVRKELSIRGLREVNNLKVLFSDEPPGAFNGSGGPASIAFVPAAAGILIAGEVVRDLLVGE